MDTGVSGWLGPRVRTEWVESVPRLRLLPPRSWKLVGTTVALLFIHQFQALFSQHHAPHGWFDDAILAFVVVALICLLVAIAGEFFGSETVAVERGELVITRGIGPLRRTFRYRAADIAELTSDEPSAKGDGKRHLGLLFIRPKSGAVRFDYRGQSVHFADRLDEAEGALIVGWLKPRLPRSAAALLADGTGLRSGGGMSENGGPSTSSTS